MLQLNTEIEMPQQNEEQQFIEEMSRRAAVDGEFRTKLLTNARATIVDVIGQPLPEHVNIKFIEKERGVDALIVLPDYVRAASELSADEREAVVGVAAEELAESGCWIMSSCWITIPPHEGRIEHDAVHASERV